jgi:cadmium resistance protein CadD (predicted permease)
MIFTVLYLLFVQFVANHRASIRFAPLADYVSYYSVLLVPFSVIAIYLIILFSRGADADLSQD